MQEPTAVDAETTTSTEPGPSGVQPSPGPPFWSPWATVGWTLCIVLAFVLVQVATVSLWRAAGWPVAQGSTVDGDLLAVGMLASAAVGGLLVVALAALRRDSRPGETLALARPSAGPLARWVGAAALLMLASDSLSGLLGRPIVPDFMIDVVRSTSFAPLLWSAVIVAAPLFEELLFRGFLLEGLRRGPLGSAGATAATALAWSATHIQYDAYEIGTIFLFGLLLGAARLRSGSLWTPIAMHVLVNLVATVETLLVLRS